MIHQYDSIVDDDIPRDDHVIIYCDRDMNFNYINVLP